MERDGANGGDERWSGAERGSSRIGMRSRGPGIPFANAAVRGTGACSGTGNRTCSEACGERSRCEAGSGIGMHLGTRQVRDENTSRAERIYSLFFFRPLSSVSFSPSLVFPLPPPFPYSFFSRSDLSPSSPSPFDSTPPPPPSSLSFSPIPSCPVQIFLPPPHLPLTPPLRLLPLPSPFPIPALSIHVSLPLLFLLPFSPLVLFFSFPFFPPSSLVLFLLSSPLLFSPHRRMSLEKQGAVPGNETSSPGTAGASWIRKHRGGTQRRRARIPPRPPRHPPPRPRPRPQRLRPAHRLRPTHHRPSRTAA
ncbi:hypothetical protein PSRA_1221 [Pseudoscardovia radai]|uniref:Uncharacterized protein n=1 Tax=Pseudoscardovia radai TaxID=987066 RepID=A0A261EWQ3_9BIFI|nr:hypothetical protein PSRA_1221 [Pseudoscardovia radai]